MRLFSRANQLKATCFLPLITSRVFSFIFPCFTLGHRRCWSMRAGISKSDVPLSLYGETNAAMTDQMYVLFSSSFPPPLPHFLSLVTLFSPLLTHTHTPSVTTSINIIATYTVYINLVLFFSSFLLFLYLFLFPMFRVSLLSSHSDTINNYTYYRLRNFYHISFMSFSSLPFSLLFLILFPSTLFLVSSYPVYHQ